MQWFKLLPQKNTELLDYEMTYKSWDIIADTALGAAANSVTVSSISTAYKTFHIYIFGQITVAANSIRLEFNGDATANHYRYQYINSAAAVTTSGSILTDTSFLAGWYGTAAAGPGAGTMYLNNTLGRKKSVILMAGANATSQIITGDWTDGASEANITQIKFTPSANQLDADTRIIVMGLR